MSQTFSIDDSSESSSFLSESSSKATAPSFERQTAVLTGNPSSTAASTSTAQVSGSFVVDPVLESLTRGCTDCEVSQVTVNSAFSAGNLPTLLELLSPGGDLVGRTTLPSELNGSSNATLSITYVSNIPANLSNQQLGSTILDITPFDGTGNPVTQLANPLTICLEPPATIGSHERVCLSYYDERKSKWVCEDRCLTNTGKKEGLFCGETGHLTNFALLLSGGAAESSDPCVSVSHDNILPWVSLGLVGAAIIIVGLSTIFIEGYTRWRAHQLDLDIERRTGINFRSTNKE